MKLSVLVVALIWIVPAVYSQETRTSANNALTVADPYYWVGSEGNLAIELVGKFQSEEKLAGTLNLSKPLGEFKAKTHPFSPRAWTLRDVLVFVDLNASGSVATWRVSGPKPLIMSYLEDLKRRFEDKTLFYDFGYAFLNVRPSRD